MFPFAGSIQLLKSVQEANPYHVYLRLLQVSVYTLNWHLSWHLIDIPIDIQLTLEWHLNWQSINTVLINCRAIVGRVLTNSNASIKNLWTPDRRSTKMSIECRLSVNKVSMECQLRVLIWAIDWYSTTDTCSTQDPQTLISMRFLKNGKSLCGI